MLSHSQAKDRALAQRIFITEHFGVGLLYSYHYNAARTLRRAQLTLHRWAELECGDGHAYVERDEATGKPRIYRERRYLAPNDPRCWSAIPDREAGALRRVAKVCKEVGLHYYHQTDPRGCALYVSTEPLTASNYSSKGIPCL